MTEEPLVTIILTTLNSEKFLARSIESCLNQSHANLELLLVDGGSTDRTLEIVAKYHDRRVRVIHQPHNSGKLPGALNLGMANADGEFITWTQDDSWYESGAIAAMLAELQKEPDVALVYTDFWIVDEHARIIQHHSANPPEPSWFLVDDVVGQCFLFRRKVYEQIGPQDTQYFPVHEVPWRIKVARQFGLSCLHVPLMYYTLHGDSLTGRIGGWELQRMMTRSLLSEKVIDQAYLRRRLGEIDVNESYEAFVLHGDYRKFWRLTISGLARNPRQIENLGYLKTMLRSVLPGRADYRTQLYQKWQAQRQAALAAQIGSLLPEGSHLP